MSILPDGVGIAFQEGAVHEGARVSFIGVADNILLITFGISAELPFLAGGETGAATSAQPGLLDLVDDLLRLKFQGFAETGITAAGDILIDTFGIDDAAVPEGDAHLRFEHGKFPEIRDTIH
jgi:hypothetical protein